MSTRNVNTAFKELVQEVCDTLSIKSDLIYAEIFQTQLVRESSRNGDVLRYIHPQTITFENPIERVLFSSNRDANPFFHLYEALWMLSGRNDLAPLKYYSSNFDNYSDNGQTLNGAYGYRWREYPRRNDEDEMNYGVVDQLQILIEHLKKEPNSRRAVLQMWNVEDDLLKIDDQHDMFSRDVCCNLSVVFSIRNGGPELGNVLDMTVFNRSNDLIWGTLGANYVHFTILQEYMAAMLGMSIGRYYQISNNLHTYLNMFKGKEWLETCVDLYESDCCGSGQSVVRKLVPLVQDTEVFDTELKEIVENNFYLPSSSPISKTPLRYQEGFFRHVAQPMFNAFHCHKRRIYDEAQHWMARVEADDWKIVGTEWIAKREQNWLKKVQAGPLKTNGIDSFEKGVE